VVSFVLAVPLIRVSLLPIRTTYTAHLIVFYFNILFNLGKEYISGKLPNLNNLLFSGSEFRFQVILMIFRVSCKVHSLISYNQYTEKTCNMRSSRRSLRRLLLWNMTPWSMEIVCWLAECSFGHQADRVTSHPNDLDTLVCLHLPLHGKPTYVQLAHQKYKTIEEIMNYNEHTSASTFELHR
jgi:hypothetical protein